MKLRLLGLLTLFASMSILCAAKSFAQNNAAPIQQNCTTTIKCQPSENGAGPCVSNEPPVTTCHSTAKSTGGLPKGTPKPVKVKNPSNAASNTTGKSVQAPEHNSGGDNKH
jgi:hypothetical protein